MSSSWLSGCSVPVIDTVHIGLLLVVVMSFVDRANQQRRYDT
jgi:hypothetical protein